MTNYKMEIYKKNIIEIYNSFNSKKTFFPGIRWAFDTLKVDTEYLVLGINPSNSYEALTKALKNANEDDYKLLIKNLKLTKDEIIKKIENIVIKIDGYNFLNDQKNYDEFLNDKNNDDYILFLQKLAHEYHKHFEKHKKFVEALGIDKYEFMDLFPIWRISQKSFKKDLKKESLKGFDKKILLEFNKLVSRHKSIKGLFFLNKSAGKFYLKKDIHEYKMKEQKISFIIPYKTLENVEKTRKSEVIYNELEVGGKKISVFVFGLGNYDWNDNALINLAEKSRQELKLYNN